jgi:hypothetical protein
MPAKQADESRERKCWRSSAGFAAQEKIAVLGKPHTTGIAQMRKRADNFGDLKR